MLALRIVLALIAIGALGLSTFLLMRQQDGVTLNSPATTLMWGGYAVAIILFVVIGFTRRKRT